MFKTPVDGSIAPYVKGVTDHVTTLFAVNVYDVEYGLLTVFCTIALGWLDVMAVGIIVVMYVHELVDAVPLESVAVTTNVPDDVTPSGKVRVKSPVLEFMLPYVVGVIDHTMLS